MGGTGIAIAWIVFVCFLCLLLFKLGSEPPSDASSARSSDYSAPRYTPKGARVKLVLNFDSGGSMQVRAPSLTDAYRDVFLKLHNRAMASDNSMIIRENLERMLGILKIDQFSQLDFSDRMYCRDLTDAVKSRFQKIEDAEKEKWKQMSEHRRFVAQQRRLMSDSLRYDVMMRDGFHCVLCGAGREDGYALHVDHILPVSKGGKTEMSNLRTLCERCNMGKRDKIEVVPEGLASPPKAADAPVAELPQKEEKKPVAAKEQKQALKDCSLEEIRRIFEDHRVMFVDNTDKGGALWVKSTPNVDSSIVKYTVARRRFTKTASAKALGGAPGWFVYLPKGKRKGTK